jgi:plastocyanin
MSNHSGLFSIWLSAAGLALVGFSTLGWAQATKTQESTAQEKQGEKAKEADKAKEEGATGAKAANLGTITGKVDTRPQKYAKDAWVYIKEVKGIFPPPEKNPEIDQKNLTFVPHILPVLVGSTVGFVNSDTVLHNVFSPDNEKYNLGSWAKGQTKTYTFKKLGVYTQLCNVHPEMQAYILVLQNPFWSEVHKDLTYKIDKVPPGTYTVVCWSERLKSVEKEVVVKAGETVTVDFSLRERK